MTRPLIVPLPVEDEVRQALQDPSRQFERGPHVLSRRDSSDDDAATFVVQDGRYISARRPGDAYAFAQRVIDVLG